MQWLNLCSYKFTIACCSLRLDNYYTGTFFLWSAQLLTQPLEANCPMLDLKISPIRWLKYTLNLLSKCHWISLITFVAWQIRGHLSTLVLPMSSSMVHISQHIHRGQCINLTLCKACLTILEWTHITLPPTPQWMRPGTTTQKGEYQRNTPQIARTQKLRMTKVIRVVQRGKLLMVTGPIKRIKGQARRSLVWLSSEISM